MPCRSQGCFRLDAIAYGFDAQTTQTEEIPKQETTSLQRTAAAVFISPGIRRPARPETDAGRCTLDYRRKRSSSLVANESARWAWLSEQHAKAPSRQQQTWLTSPLLGELDQRFGNGPRFNGHAARDIKASLSLRNSSSKPHATVANELASDLWVKD